MADLEGSAATEVAALDAQRYRVLEGKLTQMIGERLLAREVQRRGVSVEALLHAEVLSKVPPVTADDVNAFIVQNRARPTRGDGADLRLKVADYLHRLQVDQRSEALVASLRAQTPVQVYLKPADSPRVKVDPDVGFARGPREAPLTIVEFSDFQCPFCKSVVPVPARPSGRRWCRGAGARASGHRPRGTSGRPGPWPRTAAAVRPTGTRRTAACRSRAPAPETSAPGRSPRPGTPHR